MGQIAPEKTDKVREPVLRLRHFASLLLGHFLAVLYPPRCGGCDLRGTLLCEVCYGQITPPFFHSEISAIDTFASAGLFKGPLREAIHKLKYESDTPLARPLARLLSEALSCDDPWSILDGNSPVLMPVPLHGRKEHARGYNQSMLLAQELSRTTGWPIQSGLVRVRETLSQVKLDAEARKLNVAAAFAWQGGDISAPVLLIDDVCTTGATLSECAAALRLAGAVRIYALTVAKAIGSDSL